MRLSEFILANLDGILAEWESFAGTIVPEHHLDPLALRDHAKDVLQSIAADMETAQTDGEQEEKSKGHGPRAAQDSAAETHTGQRIQLGFNQEQIVSEYRALRATVIRLWLRDSPSLDSSAVDQLIRFNEGIDQALAESNARFMRDIDSARDFAIGVLAHDLRSPLQAIATGAELLDDEEYHDASEIKGIAGQIRDSTGQMSQLITSLLDFTRTRLGQRLPLHLQWTDVSEMCRRTIDELRAVHPEQAIQLDCPPRLEANVDSTRLVQMLSNLVSNALEHGSKSQPVTVLARAEGLETIIQVHNEGAPIPPAALPRLFDWSPGPVDTAAPMTNGCGHLGIGLYIVARIVEAHAGKIDVASAADTGTTFTVRLPGV